METAGLRLFFCAGKTDGLLAAAPIASFKTDLYMV